MSALFNQYNDLKEAIFRARCGSEKALENAYLALEIFTRKYPKVVEKALEKERERWRADQDAWY